MKQAAGDAIIAGGGTITHHHAVGRDHRPWYDRQRPDVFAAALQGAKARGGSGGHPQPGRAARVRAASLGLRLVLELSRSSRASRSRARAPRAARPVSCSRSACPWRRRSSGARSSHRRRAGAWPDPGRLALEVVLFVTAAAGLAATGLPVAAAALAVAFGVSTGLLLALGQRGDGV